MYVLVAMTWKLLVYVYDGTFIKNTWIETIRQQELNYNYSKPSNLHSSRPQLMFAVRNIKRNDVSTTGRCCLVGWLVGCNVSLLSIQIFR